MKQNDIEFINYRGQVQASNVDQTRSNPGQLDGTSKGGNNEGTKSAGSGGNEGGQRNNQFLLVK